MRRLVIAVLATIVLSTGCSSGASDPVAEKYRSEDPVGQVLINVSAVDPAVPDERYPAIGLLDVAVDRAELVPFDHRFAVDGTWRPDGRSILVHGFSDGTETAYLVDPESDAVEEIQWSSDDGGWHYTWSPDCEALVYQKTTDEHGSQLWVRSVDGTADRRVTALERGTPSQMHWSSTGTIVFALYVDEAFQIWSVDEDGGDVAPLVAAGEGVDVQFPRVSPDGTTLSFGRRIGDRFQLVVRPIDDSGDEAQLTDETEGALAHAWSPDGEWIIYSNDLAELFVVRPDGSDRRELATTGHPSSWGPASGSCGRTL